MEQTSQASDGHRNGLHQSFGRLDMKKLCASAIVMAAVVAGHTAYLNSSAALAQQDARPSAGMPLPPPKPFVTMDEKVAMANHIFIGTARRIYFVDHLFKEISYEQAARMPQSLTRSAILEIDVDRTLYEQKNLRPRTALMFASISKEPFGDQLSSYVQLEAKFVDKPGLFFSQVQTDKIRVDVPNEPSKVVGEITLHRFIESYAVDGPKANPLSLSYLQDTVAAIQRRREHEKRESLRTDTRKTKQ